jgi:hypothetical protein
MYLPKNVRSNRIYGFGPTEQIIVTTNTAIRRSLHQLEFYREGSQPDAFVGLPEEWNLQNVKDFQQWFDSLLSGRLGARRKVRFMPGKFTYKETKPIDLKDLYDEWLARIICFCFSVDPTPFIQQVNRSTATTSKNRALEEGAAPRQRWMKNIIDRVLSENFNSTDLEFVYIEDREQDPSAQANIDVAYAKAGIDSIDEVRMSRGKSPLGGAYSKPMLATAQGYITPGELTSTKATQEGNTSNGTEDAPSEEDGSGVKSQVPDKQGTAKPGKQPKD